MSQPLLLILAVLALLALVFVLFRSSRKRKETAVSKEVPTFIQGDYDTAAALILEGLGGQDNITSLEHCITRLRVGIKEYTAVDEKKIRAAGAAGILRPSRTAVQIIIGKNVRYVADEMKKMLQ